MFAAWTSRDLLRAAERLSVLEPQDHHSLIIQPAERPLLRAGFLRRLLRVVQSKPVDQLLELPVEHVVLLPV